MEDAMRDAETWARRHFGGADLGDARAVRRLVEVARCVAEHPGGTLHRSMADWAALMGAYRLLRRPGTTFEAVTAAHHQQTRARCREPGAYLLIEDTTEADFTSRPATEGLGRIGDDAGRGLLLHSCLALRIEGWEDDRPRVSVRGFFHQKCWARTMPSIGYGKEAKAKRLGRERESERWAEGYAKAGEPGEEVQWTHMGDRESDVFEVFEKCRQKGLQWLVRACQPRALVGECGSVFSAVAARPPLGRMEVKLRARPGRRARVAVLELRSMTAKLRGPWRPGGNRPPLETQVVEAREVGAPPGEEPLHWVLLTSWPASTLKECCRVVGGYGSRWVVEEFHQALKSGGTEIEADQLEDGEALKALIGIKALVALRLVALKLEANGDPDRRLQEGEMGPVALRLLEAKAGKPAGGWTCLTVLLAIAALGGFKGRKCDKRPGYRSLWRGWERLMTMAEGVELLLNSS